MAEKQKFFEGEGHEQYKGQVEACYSSAGDKYRLTLINVSGVEHWFDPSLSPKPSKKRSILLVPCSRHCRVSDIDLESGQWIRDVEYDKNDGTREVFKQGESAGQLLAGWRRALLQFSEAERATVLQHLDIWGQPRAWTDELVASWTVEFIRREWGQSLVFADCLSSQWTEAVCLRAWMENVIWAPYAPDVTSFLQEPDTHEHSQLKAKIREVKSELHWALESEWLNKQKTPEGRDAKYPSSWGPFECLYVVSKAYERFCEESRGKVPLEGLQANQMLRVRPTEATETEPCRLELVTGLEPWSFSTEAGRGIEPRLAHNRDELVGRWENNEPPEPDWSWLDGRIFQQDDQPPEPAADEPVFEVAFASLELSEHQKAMLKGPEERMAELIFPASIAARATGKRKSKRKNRWASKFRGHFAGKSARKWVARLKAGERAQLASEATGKGKVKAIKVVVKKAESKPSSLKEKLKKSVKAAKNKAKDVKNKIKSKVKALAKANLVEVAKGGKGKQS